MSRPCTSRDAGFTVVELMVVVLLVGLLAGLAIPALRAQAIHAKDATVARDMQTYATAADRYYSATFGYPTDASGFDLRDGKTPFYTAGNTFRIFTIAKGAKAGYVIYGQNTTARTVWALSSYDGRAPEKTTLTALPEVPPSAGALGTPTTVVAADWTTLGGSTFGAVPVAGTTTSPVMAFTDPAYAATVRDTLGSATSPTIDSYAAAPWRIVALASPVADRAIEVVTDSATNDQGVVLYRQPKAASWPTQVPVSTIGDTWTVSAWVKTSTVGQSARLGCRFTSSAGVLVSETNAAAVTSTGDWQRLTFTCPSTTATQTGSFVQVQVLVGDKVPGTKFWVTAPQVNHGATATAFQRQ